MALLLRKVTKPKWYSPDWLRAGHVPADALTDLRTTQNELSVWYVRDDGSNLDGVIAAMASRFERLLDYAVIDEAILNELEIQWQPSPGDTHHAEANAEWHCDLKHLSAAQISSLAARIKLGENDHIRVPVERVRALLIRALEEGALSQGAMNANLLKQIGVAGADE